MTRSDQVRTPLKTWKEIAGYLGVSIRTAQNWECEKSLPIRRLVGDKSQVWALRDELDRWRVSQEQPFPRVQLPRI